MSDTKRHKTTPAHKRADLGAFRRGSVLDLAFRNMELTRQLVMPYSDPDANDDAEWQMFVDGETESYDDGRSW